ncbi:MAG: YdeI/OmpD-associated family protein [Actinobacteria bacterium]|nr:YdeI/OmpD-associated family protein [Actinomycetota bacterium]
MLMKSRRMHPSGMAEVDKAKADGRWAAAAFFHTIGASNRYAILYRIQDAKKPETRAARIEKFVTILAEGKKLY